MRKKRARYGDGCIYVRGRILWIRWREAKRRPDGSTESVQKCKSTHSEDRKVAQKMLRAKLQEAGGRRPMAVDPTEVSYEDIRENFLAECVQKKIRSVIYSKDGTPTLETINRLNKAFAGWRAADFTTTDLKRFRIDAKADGMSDARANRYMATLRAMFRQALKDELLTRAELPGYFPMVKEPNEARGAIFIEDEWYEPLRRTLTEPLRSAFTLAYHTGMRVHEVQRLRWRHFNFERRVITLPGEITKTGKPRLVPLPTDFDLAERGPNDVVFPLEDYRWEWRRACVSLGFAHYQCGAKDCGVECQGQVCPNHGQRIQRQLHYVGPLLRHCRHTWVRNASDAGLSEKRIMEISGHLTRSMFDRYNIGREKDVELSGELLGQAHRARQKRLTSAPTGGRSKVQPIRRQA